METAIRDASELQSEQNPNPWPVSPSRWQVDWTQQTNTSENGDHSPCYLYDGNTHTTHNCFYKDQICNHCGKQGHFQRVCRSKQQGKPKKATITPEVHAVEVDIDVDAYEDILATF